MLLQSPNKSEIYKNIAPILREMMCCQVASGKSRGVTMADGGASSRRASAGVSQSSDQEVKRGRGGGCEGEEDGREIKCAVKAASRTFLEGFRKFF